MHVYVCFCLPCRCYTIHIVLFVLPHWYPPRHFPAASSVLIVADKQTEHNEAKDQMVGIDVPAIHEILDVNLCTHLVCAPPQDMGRIKRQMNNHTFCSRPVSCIPSFLLNCMLARISMYPLTCTKTATTSGLRWQ